MVEYKQLVRENLMLREECFKGQTVLITGGGTGLGLEMARGFGWLGAKVIIVSRKEEVLQAATEAMRSKSNIDAEYFVCDVRERAQIDHVIETIYSRGEKIDLLINNAAGNFISPTEMLSGKAFDLIVDIVLKGTYNWTLALGKQWIKAKQPGRVLNMVTTYASTGSAFVVPSACGKAGVLALTRSLAVEWAKYKIRINAVAPGPFPTKGAFERLFPADTLSKLNFLKRVPAGRVGEIHELVNLVHYLCSEYSDFMTGEVVTIDGGEWLKGAGQFNIFSELNQDDWLSIQEVVRKAKSS